MYERFLRPTEQFVVSGSTENFNVFGVEVVVPQPVATVGTIADPQSRT